MLLKRAFFNGAAGTSSKLIARRLQFINSCWLAQHSGVDLPRRVALRIQFEFLSNGGNVTLTPPIVLAKLRQAARSRAGFILSIHALSRTMQRNITRQDVASVFLTAQQADEQDNGTWRVNGLDEDGRELNVVVFFDHRIQVITAFS